MAWKCNKDENKCIDKVLMDFPKAFDCISHGLPQSYGLSNNECEHMSSYVSDGYEKMKITKEIIS